ncbi:MAG TPA: hypothetical protein VGM63_07080 [Mucilaginibacter sp.]
MGKATFEPEYGQNKRIYFFPETQGAAAPLVLDGMAFWMGMFLDIDLVNIQG